MIEGSLEAGVTHPYDTGSSALGLAAIITITDASVVIVRLQWLNQLENYSRDTSKYSP